MAFIIRGGKIIQENNILSDHCLIIEGGKIQKMIHEEELQFTNESGYQIINVDNGYISPGWIDIHTHGALGIDTMDADLTGLKTIARFKARHGVTAFVPTAITNPYDRLEATARVVGEAIGSLNVGAKILGFHLEGPFISPDRKGAHQAKWMRNPDSQWTTMIQQMIPGQLMVTVAPELPGALNFIKQMRAQGIIIGLGHTNASYEQVQMATQFGANYGIHLFNGMKEMHHREPGTVGAMLDLPLNAEIIADGIHVHPAIIRIASKVKSPDKLILITDATAAAGLKDGKSHLGGVEIYKKGREARLADGTLAGSVLTLDAAVRYCIHTLQLPVVNVMRMVSANPARLLNLYQQKGSIVPGKDADLTILTSEFRVQSTMVKGRIVF